MLAGWLAGFEASQSSWLCRLLSGNILDIFRLISHIVFPSLVISQTPFPNLPLPILGLELMMEIHGR
jgi:hypothetical protein